MNTIGLQQFTKVVELQGKNYTSSIMPDDHMLQMINHHSLVPLKADDVYVRKMRLAHTALDMDNTQFSREILGCFASDAKQGRSFLVGHGRQTAPEGLIFDGDVVDESPEKAWLECMFYTAVTPYNEHFRRQIDAGVFKYVSIAFFADHLECSICKQNMLWWLVPEDNESSAHCNHILGRQYDGQTCTGTWVGEGMMTEGSIVYLGAQPGAMLTKTADTIAEMRRQLSPPNYVVSKQGLLLGLGDATSPEELEFEKKWEDNPSWTEIRYQVRDPGLFRPGTFRSQNWTGVAGLRRIMGKLKRAMDGHATTSMVIQSLRFKKPQWTLAKAKAWVQSHSDALKQFDSMELNEAFIETSTIIELESGGFSMTKGASGSLTLPLAPEDTPWNWNASVANEILGAGKGEQGEELNWGRFAQAHFWRDADNPENRKSYKLPFARMFGDTLKAVWKGVAAALVAMKGGRGGVQIPDEDRVAVLRRIKTYYKRFGKPFPTDTTGKELEPDTMDEVPYQETLWLSGEDIIFEELQFEGNLRSAINILTHWKKEGRDLSSWEELCTEAQTVLSVQRSQSGDQSTRSEQSSGVPIDELLAVLQQST